MKPIASQAGSLSWIPASMPIEVSVLGLMILFSFIASLVDAFFASSACGPFFCNTAAIGIDIAVMGFSLVTGYWILTKQIWGFYGSVGLAFLALFNIFLFPWSTIFGLIMLFVLFARPPVRAWFNPVAPASRPNRGPPGPPVPASPASAQGPANAPRVQPPAPAPQSFCTRCAARLRVGAAFCGVCGERVG